MSGPGSEDLRVIPREEDVEVGDLWSSRRSGERSTRRARHTPNTRWTAERPSQAIGGRRARRTRRRELRRARRRRFATVTGIVLLLVAGIVALVLLLPDLRRQIMGTSEDRGVGALLTASEQGETELDRIARVRHVIGAVLAATAHSPEALAAAEEGDLTTLSSDLPAARVGTTWAAAARAVVDGRLDALVLPVGPLSPGEEGSFRIDRSELGAVTSR